MAELTSATTELVLETVIPRRNPWLLIPAPIVVVVHISTAMLIEEPPEKWISAVVIGRLELIVAISEAWLTNPAVISPAIKRLG